MPRGLGLHGLERSLVSHLRTLKHEREEGRYVIKAQRGSKIFYHVRQSNRPSTVIVGCVYVYAATGKTNRNNKVLQVLTGFP